MSPRPVADVIEDLEFLDSTAVGARRASPPRRTPTSSAPGWGCRRLRHGGSRRRRQSGDENGGRGGGRLTRPVGRYVEPPAMGHRVGATLGARRVGDAKWEAVDEDGGAGHAAPRHS